MTAATASELNTNNCQFLDAFLQLICFILNHNAFTFDNQFFTQTHGTAIGTKFAPEYAKIFMHMFEQEFFIAQDPLQPTLYTSCTNIFFFWPHGEESLKQLFSDINRFHPTIRLTMDYSSESVSILDTRVSIKLVNSENLSVCLRSEADDWECWGTILISSDTEEVSVQMQQDLDNIQRWANKWQIDSEIFAISLLQKFDFPAMKFTLYFLGYEDKKEIPADKNEHTAWTFSRRATIELT
eukprot:g43349.t1